MTFSASDPRSRIVEDLDAIQRDLVFDRLVDAIEGRPSHDQTVMRARAEDAMLRRLNEDGAGDGGMAMSTGTARSGPVARGELAGTRSRKLSRLWRWPIIAAAATATALAWLTLPAPAAERIEGRATVVDGDTIGVEGTKARIRLYGADAPESKQTCDDAVGKRYLCGARAAEALAAIIGRNDQVVCFEEDRDRYGRIVAECATRDNTVINAEMIRQGWALEYRQYSDGRYDQEEAEAKAARRGLWAGRFVEPWDWRRGQKLPSETAAVVAEQGAPSAKCLIKGNVSSDGRIYHKPGQQNYERTQIDARAGERWFCSEAEAKAAGWRAAKR